MRIALIHNPEAGDGDIEVDDLHALLKGAGHGVEVFGEKAKAVREAIASDPDVIAVAGGDGTVARAAIVCFEENARAPLLIIPVGTANNIARSLGFDRPIASLVAEIPSSGPVPLDIGRADGPWGTRHFVEGGGVGFIGTMLRHPLSIFGRARSAIRAMLTGDDMPARMAKGLARLIRAQTAMSLAIVADGESLDGDYIAAEAMNVRELGPNAALAPTAEWDDGMLDLVLVRPEDREVLASSVEGQSTRIDPSPGIVRRVKRIEMTWPWECGHLDDTPWPERGENGSRVTITVAGAVPVLCAPRRR